ncbi:MAG: hypothetical protein U5K31_12700 [Balneolaceae bacterium]|nr:hypothetical protein [Balneolaceae bacterium]
MLFFTAREFYTIKGSMTLLVKMLDEYEEPVAEGVNSSEVKKQV